MWIPLPDELQVPFVFGLSFHILLSFYDDIYTGADTFPSAASFVRPPPFSRDEISLFDPTGALVSSVGWESAEMGSVLRLQPDGTTFRLVPMTKNVVDTLVFLGGYERFVEALKVCYSL